MTLPRDEIERRGRETARSILRALREEELVAQFVDAYVARHNRGGLKSSRLRYRELLATITREAVLAMATKVARDLPRHFTGRVSGVLTGEEAEAAELYREKLAAGLVDHLTWSAAEAEEFRRDLSLYAHLTTAVPQAATRRLHSEISGPFVDRCALLLDPSLLNKAQHAAAKFLAQLESKVEEILREMFPPEKKHGRGRAKRSRSG